MTDLEVLKNALIAFGWDDQREIFFEEELDFLEALADVIIMAEQMAMHLDGEVTLIIDAIK